MAIKLFPFDDQPIANLAPHDQHHDFVSLNIVQCSQIAYAQLIFSQRIGTKPLDRFACRIRPILDVRDES
jgi:hypothetical protein